jgi:hypothetical protein
MGVNIFHGFNTFNDYGKQLASATITYVDGDTSVVRFHAGGEVRDYWDSGPTNCGGLQYIMNDRPSDPLTGYIYETGGQYFDAQESRLPKNRRAKRVASITLAGTYLPHSCGVFAGSRLSGLSVWSSFRLAKASGADSVVRQSQTTGHNHGGYVFNNDVVGWRRHTDGTGCKITSLAVAYTYSGFACSVDSLNAFLQRSQGYMPSQVCVIQSVAADGSSVTFTPQTQDDTRLKITDTFLIERGVRSNPLATYQVDAAGHATRIARYNNSVIPVRGDVGRVYWNSIPEIADKYTHPGLRSKYVPDTPQAAAIVESLLVRDIPVQLNVGPMGGHWVVADGMTSSFRPDSTAAGTYSIKDPYDPRNYTKLIQGQYSNVFTQARYLEPTGFPLPSSPFAVASDPAGLSVLADGAWRIEIIDPLGRHMIRDATTGEGIYDIPDASIEDVSSEHDNGGGLDVAPTAYDVEVPTTVDGHYTVNVYSNAGLSLSASGYDAAGVFATDIVADTTAGNVGGRYDILYSSSGQSVAIGYTGALGVEAAPARAAVVLRARRNPSSGPIEFLIAGGTRAPDVIEIFDVGGRSVGRVDVSGDGMQSVTWDWRASRCKPGVYLARLRSGAGQVARFVILR